MAKKPTPSSASARQEKIRAAQQAQGGAANKIVVATVVVIVAIIAVVGGVVFLQQSEKDDITGGGNALRFRFPPDPARGSVDQGFLVLMMPHGQLAAHPPRGEQAGGRAFRPVAQFGEDRKDLLSRGMAH